MLNMSPICNSQGLWALSHSSPAALYHSGCAQQPWPRFWSHPAPHSSAMEQSEPGLSAAKRVNTLIAPSQMPVALF